MSNKKNYPSQKGNSSYSINMDILFGIYVKTKLVKTQQTIFGQLVFQQLIIRYITRRTFLLGLLNKSKLPYRVSGW